MKILLRILKMTILSCVIHTVISPLCFSQNKNNDINENAIDDLLIQCDGKMLQRLDICFYRKEGHLLFTQKLFRLISSTKKDGIYLYETDNFSSKIISADHKAMRNVFTAEEFRKRHEHDKAMKRIFSQIDPYFIDLSNENKIKMLEDFIASNDKRKHNDQILDLKVFHFEDLPKILVDDLGKMRRKNCIGSSAGLTHKKG